MLEPRWKEGTDEPYNMCLWAACAGASQSVIECLRDNGMDRTPWLQQERTIDGKNFEQVVTAVPRYVGGVPLRVPLATLPYSIPIVGTLPLTLRSTTNAQAARDRPLSDGAALSPKWSSTVNERMHGALREARRAKFEPRHLAGVFTGTIFASCSASSLRP